MTAHRAACNQDEAEIRCLAKQPDGLQAINEVEAAGNTPLHNAAYIGWCQGAELLISLGTDQSYVQSVVIHVNFTFNGGIFSPISALAYTLTSRNLCL